MDLDKSSEEDDEVESEVFTFQTKGKHVNIWMRIVFTDIFLVFVNEIKDELNCRIPY